MRRKLPGILHKQSRIVVAIVPVGAGGDERRTDQGSSRTPARIYRQLKSANHSVNEGLQIAELTAVPLRRRSLARRPIVAKMKIIAAKPQSVSSLIPCYDQRDLVGVLWSAFSILAGG